MSRLLVFTENYHVPTGCASYIVDLLNGSAGLFDEVVLVSNPGGFAADTSSRLLVPHTMQIAQVWTADRLGLEVPEMTWLPKRSWFSPRIHRMAIVHDPRVFAFNVSVCRRTIRRVRPTAVFAYNGGYPAGRSVLSMVVAAKREKLPVALGIVSVPTPRPAGILGEWEGRMDTLVGGSVDVVVVNAHAIGLALSDVRGLPKPKIQVVHNALPDSTQSSEDWVRDENAPLRIGCVARLDAMKGIQYLVEAFAVVSSKHQNVELMLVGDGPDRENIKNAVTRFGLDDKVLLTGHYDGDVNDLVRTFDIYAFPSLWEGLPYALLEAMRARCSIVATDVGGVSEAIIDGDTGLLVPAKSAERMAEAILRLIQDPDLRRKIGCQARSRFEESFSLEAMGRRTVQVLKESGLAKA